jgi:hypothetical protein
LTDGLFTLAKITSLLLAKTQQSIAKAVLALAPWAMQQ